MKDINLLLAITYLIPQVCKCAPQNAFSLNDSLIYESVLARRIASHRKTRIESILSISQFTWEVLLRLLRLLTYLLTYYLSLQSTFCEQYLVRGVNGGWAEWAIAQPGFGRIEGAAGQRRCAALLLAHPALGSYLRPC